MCSNGKLEGNIMRKHMFTRELINPENARDNNACDGVVFRHPLPTGLGFSSAWNCTDVRYDIMKWYAPKIRDTIEKIWKKKINEKRTIIVYE